MANSRLMVGITGGNEHDGDEMVRQHLPMILAALLDVDDQDLLQPEGPLAQHVSLGQTVKFSGGPVGPELLHVEVIRRGRVQVLYHQSVRRIFPLNQTGSECQPTQPIGHKAQ
jgi:hypothetical protein